MRLLRGNGERNHLYGEVCVGGSSKVVACMPSSQHLSFLMDNPSLWSPSNHHKGKGSAPLAASDPFLGLNVQFPTQWIFQKAALKTSSPDHIRC